MTRLEVETIKPHMSGRTLHGVGDVYEEDTEAIRQKVAAGLVRRVEKKAKATGPSRNKAETPPADKALEAWPLQTPPEDYIAQHEGEKDLSDAVAARLKLARAHVKAAK